MNYINAKRLLKSEMVRRGVSTGDLVNLLKNIGHTESKASIDNKISRGKFTAGFFLDCLYVIGCRKIDIYELDEYSNSNQK